MGGDADFGRRLTAAERLEIRTRIAAGKTHWETAEAVGCSTKMVQRLLVKTGGLPSRKRRRSPLRLSLADREEMSRGIRAGESFQTNPRRPGRAPSTISCEAQAHWSRGRYRAWRADKQAVQAARRPKVPQLARQSRLRAEVERRLAQRWSPQQISRRLVVDFPDDPGIPVYFCDSRSLWQRGTGENTNGLLRQYLPRKMNLSEKSQAELDVTALEINGRPRQSLDWKKPSEVLSGLSR